MDRAEPLAARSSPIRSTEIYRPLMYADQFGREKAGGSPDSRVSILAYGSVVLLAGSLAIAQFYFLPNNLGITEFGLAVLGISVMQAALLFSDLGSINASLRSDLSDDLRVALRVNAVSISSIVCLGGIIVSCGFGIIGASFGYVSAAAFACALLLVSGKAHASAAVQMGDEKGATRHNVIWQNSPKLGSILGSLGATAFASMLGAAVTSALFSRPQIPHKPRWSFVRINRNVWLPGLAVSASAFLMTWADTYSLSIVAGVDEAGQYQAIVRPLTGVAYLYLPITALIQAAHNARVQRRVKLLTFSGIALGGLGSTAIAVFLVIFGRDIWPEFRFDTKVVVAATVAATAMCVASIFGVQLTLRGKHVIASVHGIIGAALLFVLSLLTVGTMGALGAGLASAVAWTLVTVCHCFVLFTERRRKEGGVRAHDIDRSGNQVCLHEVHD